MKKKVFFIGCITATILSCNPGKGTDIKVDSTATAIDTAKKTAEVKAPVTDSSLQVTAKFVDYTLGDASHFSFEDKTGKEIEFGDNEDTLTKFAVELPKNKANETNQGWGSNKTLQGKWFSIKYVIKKLPQYQDGPLADIKVIVEAKPAQ